MDSFQHVNNTVYFKYQETSRLYWFSRLMDNMPNTFDKDGFNRGTALGPIISDTYVAFKFPVSCPDILLVGATIKPG